MLIKTICTLSVSLCMLSLLTACEPVPPMQFGMQQSQFQQLTKDQQDQVIAGYNQRQQTEADNAVVNNAINSATSLIALKQKPVTTEFSEPKAIPTMPAMPSPPPIPPMPNFPTVAGNMNSSYHMSGQQSVSTESKSVSNSVGFQEGL